MEDQLMELKIFSDNFLPSHLFPANTTSFCYLNSLINPVDLKILEESNGSIIT